MRRGPLWTRVASLLAAVHLAAGFACAEPLGRYGYLIPFGGYTYFDSDSVGGGIAPELRDRAYVGARFGYRLHRWVSLELGGGYTPTFEVVAPGREVDHLHASGDVLVTPLSGAVRPFLMLGGGASRLKPNGGNSVNQGNVEVGAGADLWFNDAFGMRVEARDVMWFSRDDITDIRTHTAILGAGLTFALGATPRDTDGDGVPDKTDQCPDTGRGAQVDAGGCPKDSDGDQVLDGLDQCVGTRKGCTVDARGCPSDADGDGVCDGVDTCARTPKGATVDAKGCPSDADRDGVCDGLDQCPDTTPALPVSSDGCPVGLIERETELLDTGMIWLQNINFDTNKAVLLPESFPALDIVGQVLGKWPELRIEVRGHTDSRGSDAHNQKLSEARAEAVLTYIKSRYPGLADEQYTSRGYGESKALVPNTSQLNWSKNRRVEFVVLNKDALRREIERRRVLEKEPPK